MSAAGRQLADRRATRRAVRDAEEDLATWGRVVASRMGDALDPVTLGKAYVTAYRHTIRTTPTTPTLTLIGA